MLFRLLLPVGVSAEWTRTSCHRDRSVPQKILILGRPGAGKTTLTNVLGPLLKAVVFNADEVRANTSRDLGFSHADRIEHARRMGVLCDRVVASGDTFCLAKWAVLTVHIAHRPRH